MRKLFSIVVLSAGLSLAAPVLACPTHNVSVDTKGGNGKPQEVKQLLDTPFVKLLQITLRGGSTLADHDVAEAITVQAVSGSAVLEVAGKKEKEKLSPGRVVLVAPKAKHAIVPDGKADVVLLVHVLRMGGSDGGAHDHGHKH